MYMEEQCSRKTGSQSKRTQEEQNGTTDLYTDLRHFGQHKYVRDFLELKLITYICRFLCSM